MKIRAKATHGVPVSCIGITATDSNSNKSIASAALVAEQTIVGQEKPRWKRSPRDLSKITTFRCVGRALPCDRGRNSASKPAEPQREEMKFI